MKRSKKLLTLLVVLAMAMSLMTFAACGKSGGDTPAAAPAEAPAEDKADTPAAPAGDITIGVSVASATNNPHIVAVCSTLQEAIEAQGWTCIMQDANNDASRQSTQFDNLVTQEVDLIVYWAHDADAAVADVRKAQDAGIPVVAYFADVSPEAKEYVEAYVGADQLVIAGEVAKTMDEILGGSGKIAIINGMEGATDFVLRSQGFRETIATLGDYEILAEEYCGVDRTNCQSIMENYLTTYPEIDAVFVTNDSFGMGAYNAISAAGKTGEIKIFSIDGENEVLELIKAGGWTSDVYQTPPMMAAKCVEVVSQVLNGTFDGQYEQNTDYYVVTADNVDEFLEG